MAKIQVSYQYILNQRELLNFDAGYVGMHEQANSLSVVFSIGTILFLRSPLGEFSSVPQ